jgi:hypothetical protein
LKQTIGLEGKSISPVAGVVLQGKRNWTVKRKNKTSPLVIAAETACRIARA